MICKAKLNSKINSFKIVLSNESININEQMEKETIYQNQAYEVLLYFQDIIKEIKKINLFINNEAVNYRFKHEFKLVEKGVYRFPYEYIFSTLFGFANISIEVIYEDESIEYFYSEYMSVAIENNNEDALISIQKMIDYIYEKNLNLLYASNIDRVSNILSGTQYSQNRSMDTEIALLNEIITAYNTNLKYFMSDLKYKIVCHNEVDDLKKLRKLDSDTIRFIVTNPQQLIPVNYNTGIKCNYQNYEPIKTLVSKKSNLYDIYENRVILGFLRYLINEVETKIAKITKTLQENKINVHLKYALEKNYISSSEIVYKYSRIVMKQYLKKLNNICDAIHKLYFTYKNIMNCSEVIINSSPRPTNIFISINHYRNIFNEIDKWFRHGNYDMSKNKEVLSFLTADQIYEYYCLLNIIQLLKDMNYIEDVENRKCYFYDVPNDLYRNTNINNTFYFSNNNEKLVLYFQPVIYSYESKTRNDITLFRTDTVNNYFAPDFIIKLDNGDNNVKYVILDSKWSKYETIKNYRFNEAAIKYLFSTKDQRNLYQPVCMWLLQGKDDFHKKNISYYNNSEISRMLNNAFRKSSGIVKLTPNKGTKYIEVILKELLFN